MDPQDLADALTALRAKPPLVQCLTNIVVAGWTANVLLAVGAAPAMVDNPQEAGQFATIAGGVLVNLGTPYDDTARAMHLAVAGAKQMRTPWVLDPVAAGALVWRTTLAHQLFVKRDRPSFAGTPRRSWRWPEARAGEVSSRLTPLRPLLRLPKTLPANNIASSR
jgi:hydroxyethylthiazole kinase